MMSDDGTSESINCIRYVQKRKRTRLKNLYISKIVWQDISRRQRRVLKHGSLTYTYIGYIGKKKNPQNRVGICI